MSPRSRRTGSRRSPRAGRGDPNPASAPTGSVPAPLVREMGASALLLELPDLASVLAWHAELLARPVTGQVEALAAARTVLVTLADPQHREAARAELGARSVTATDAPEARRIDIDVVYDGDDLDEVAERTGLSRDEVIAAHTGTAWTAAFSGFAPGFSYLSGGDPRLVVPRRETPRTAVPTGAVALAGEFSAVYPRRSPGGWQLIGHSTATLWDPEVTPPTLIAPGDRVRFRAVRETVRTTPRTAARRSGRTRPTPPPQSEGAWLEVIAPGPRLLVQDEGRPGHGDQGVPTSGAADLPSAHQANRLVGNPAGAAVLEMLWGPVALRAHGTVVIALTGADGEASIEIPDPTDPGGEPSRAGEDESEERTNRSAPRQQAFALPDGAILHITAPPSGIRGYLGVRGGIAVPEVLGSRASDTLSGIGPQPLGPGDRLPVGPADPGASVGEPEPPATDVEAARDEDGAVVLPVLPGPRADRFGTGGTDPLTGRSWRVSEDSDRVGLRLATDGPPLQREDDSELASEGMVLGAIQVPPDGLPVVFLADHPTTGGYPVIAVLDPAAVPLAAQLRAGDPIRFVALTPRER